MLVFARRKSTEESALTDTTKKMDNLAIPDFMEELPLGTSNAAGFKQINYVNASHVGMAFSAMNVMRRSGQLCDISLEVSNNQIKGHKVVLAATSAYFNAMFNSKYSVLVVNALPQLACQRYIRDNQLEQYSTSGFDAICIHTFI